MRDLLEIVGCVQLNDNDQVQQRAELLVQEQHDVVLWKIGVIASTFEKFCNEASLTFRLSANSGESEGANLMPSHWNER